VLEKMSSQYKLELDTRPPSIPYRETIAARAEGHSRHKKQTGGAGQFGEVFLKVEPLPRGSGFEFVDSVKGGAIPNQFIPSVEKGVRSVLDTGYLAGFPLQDVRVIVYDGKSHPVDSKDVAFMSAGRKAFLDALAKARPMVLEPIVNVDIIAPETKMGDIAGELSGHRGQIKGSDTPRPGTVQISAQAPLFRARALSGPPQVAHRGPRLLQPRVQPLRAGAAAAAAEARRRAPAGRHRRLSRAMHYVSRGRGAPPLVFVHGFACSHQDWRLQLDFFSKTNEVVACDLRGHGATPGGRTSARSSTTAGMWQPFLQTLIFRKQFLSDTAWVVAWCSRRTASLPLGSRVSSSSMAAASPAATRTRPRAPHAR